MMAEFYIHLPRPMSLEENQGLAEAACRALNSLGKADLVIWRKADDLQYDEKTKGQVWAWNGSWGLGSGNNFWLWYDEGRYRFSSRYGMKEEDEKMVENTISDYLEELEVLEGKEIHLEMKTKRVGQKINTPTSLIKIYSGDELGAYEFNTGEVLFWTSGRGGFVIEGGLGIFTDHEDWANRMENLLQIGKGQLSDNTVKFVGTFEHSIEQFGADLLEKAEKAHKGSGGGKYDLGVYLRCDDECGCEEERCTSD